MLSTVPAFPNLVPLGLEHQPLLEGLFRDLQPQVSELTFTNLYIWRESYGAQLTRLGEVVCVFSLRADPAESFLLPPLGPGAGEDHVRQGLRLLAEAGHDPKLRRLDRREADRLGLREEAWDFSPDRDNWDYVYRVADLIALDPERYPEKARHLRRFGKYQAEYRRLTPDLVPACQALQDLWCDEKHCDLFSTLRAEARAVKEVLERLEELGASPPDPLSEAERGKRLTGGCLLVNGRAQAFSLGEPLNASTVVIHIEKATPELPGAFQAINQQFLEHEWAGYEFVNREQDVGEPGLRQSKESYHPEHMVEKFVVREKS
jgi:hypothetical protein